MRKKILSLLAVCSLVITCAGCVTKSGDKKEEPKSSETTSSASAAAPDTEKNEKTTEKTADTTPAATGDNSGKTALLTLPGGRTLYLEDGKTESEWEGGWVKSFDAGYVRIASGLYHDSISEPGLSDTQNYEDSGEPATLGEIREVKPGDTFGGLTVSKVELYVSKQGENSYYVFGNNAELAGEITLTGVLRYYYDEQYSINSGDMIFAPDACYKGLPAACDPLAETLFVSPDFDVIESYNDDGISKKNGDGPAYYTDSQKFRLGNLFSDYADNGALNDILNGGNTNVSRKVEVTLTDVKLTYSEQFGDSHCSAKIKSIKTV